MYLWTLTARLPSSIPLIEPSATIPASKKQIRQMFDHQISRYMVYPISDQYEQHIYIVVCKANFTIVNLFTV